MRGELHALLAADEILQQLGRESGEIEVGRGVEGDGGIEVEQFRSFLCAEFGESLSMLEFADRIAGHGKRSHAVQTVFRMPGVWRKSSELKFEGQAGATGGGRGGGVGV